MRVAKFGEVRVGVGVANPTHSSYGTFVWISVFVNAFILDQTR